MQLNKFCVNICCVSHAVYVTCVFNVFNNDKATCNSIKLPVTYLCSALELLLLMLHELLNVTSADKLCCTLISYSDARKPGNKWKSAQTLTSPSFAVRQE